jgi:hypothetical protein
MCHTHMYVVDGICTYRYVRSTLVVHGRAGAAYLALSSLGNQKEAVRMLLHSAGGGLHQGGGGGGADGVKTVSKK